MKTTGTLKRNRRMALASIIAALFALITFAGFSQITPPVGASAATSYEYVALGDSITAGWGLDDDSTAENEADTYGFVGMFASQLGLTYYNAGVNGQTTASLISSLSDPTSTYFDSTALAAIPSADVITITIGGNDLMAVFYSFIAEVVTGGAYTASEVETALADISNNLVTALTILYALQYTDYSSELENYTAFTTAVTTAVTNINTVTSAIKQYNPSAVILVANQYNPYQWLDSSYQYIINLFETGVTNYNDYLTANTNGLYTIVDIYSAFAASTNTELTNVTISSYEFDFHPNDSGHLVFKNTMITAYNEALASGSGSGTTVVSDSSIQLGTGSITGYDSTNGYDYIYLGFDSNGNKVKWRVLDDQTNTGAAGFYLLSDQLVDSGVTFSSSESKVWQGSDAQAWCEDYYTNNLSAIEQSAIMATYKNDSAFVDSINSYTYAATDGILNGDYVFFMSAEEMYNSDYGFTDDDATRKVDMYQASTSTVNTAVYFLRSPSIYSKIVGSVSQNGKVSSTGAVYSYGARPAMNFDTTNVLFVSAASGGKSASGMDSGLTATDTYTGSEWKATIYDSNRAGFTASKVSRGINTVTIEYSGAKIGTNEYLSAVVLDSNGELTQYGRIAKLDGTTYSNSGTVTVDISSLADTDTLYIINEQYNGDYESDASSALTAIDTTMTLDDLTSEVARLEAELLANNQAIITSANSNLTTSLVNFAAIVNDGNSTTADIIDGVMALLTEYSSAYTSWEQITAQSPTDTTLLTGLATLEATLTTAESAITAAITTLQTNIATQISDLQTADADLADDIADLLTDLTALQTTVGNLDGTYATDSELAAAVTELNTAIANAQQAAIDAAQTSLNAAIATLEAAITSGDSDLADDIAALDTAYKAADTIINGLITDLQDKDVEIAASITTLESTMNTADAALQTAIDAVQYNLDKAVDDLNKAISDGDSDLADEIAALEAAMNSADDIINSDIADLQYTDRILEINIASLNTRLLNAQETLQNAVDAVQQNLDDAVANLEAAITAGDEDLSDEIEALNTAFTAAANLINTNIAALQTADGELETSIAALETAVNSTDGVLQTAIDELQQQLNDLKAEHEAAISDAQTSTDTLQTVCIAMFTVTGILSVAGVGMSAALWIVTRKRK